MSEILSPLPVLALFLAGPGMAMILPRRAVQYSYAFLAAASLCAVFMSFSSAFVFEFSIPITGYFMFHFHTGGLGSFFSLILSVMALSVSLYSIGYAKGSRRPRIKAVFFGLFILSMYAVFFAADVLTFLISWEVMSLTSYFLVTAEIEDSRSHHTGLLYAVMTHAGTALIITAFLMAAASAGSLEFSAIRDALAGESPLFRSVVFLLALAGFGTKAGIVPLHIWLPEAHPAAPSNASALMSGVMIKSGIYGIIFVSVYLLGSDTAWWGWVILIIGAVSSVLGVLYALMEHDIKRLLAYHSVENIGIILLGIGSGMVFQSYGMTSLAALAIGAGLYHTVNHALFKGLLFMGAGSLLHSLHTRNMEDMGGLLKRMPWTGMFFLIGSVAICAMPPFNGFVSEWFTFQALVLGVRTPVVATKVLMLISGAALALTGALAAACFVKAFGISFLGQPRSSKAETASEAPPSMLAGMAVPALLCLLLGVAPGPMLRMIGNIGLPVLQGVEDMNLTVSGVIGVIQTPDGFSTLSMMILTVLLAGMLVAGVLAVRISSGSARITRGDVWDCGLGAVTPRMQYTATAFTKPVRIIFRKLYRPHRDIRIKYSVMPFFVDRIRYHSEITPIFDNWLYKPVKNFLNRAARLIQPLQSGSLHLYLGYILATLIILLLVWGR